GASGYATISAGAMTSKVSTINITATKSTSTQTITVRYAGDDNHNSASTTFTLEVPAVYVNIVTNAGGTGVVNNTVSGTTNEVVVGSNVTFTAKPNANYGLIKYVIGNGDAQYISSATSLTAQYTSPSITINDELLNGSNSITITLTFDKVVEIDMTIANNEDGAISNTIESKYEDNTVAHTYKDNTLTVFESSNITIDLSAGKVDNQHYVINNVAVNGQTEASNTKQTTISTSVSDLISKEDSSIEIKPAKVYDASDRDVVNGSTVVAKYSVDADSNDTVMIESTKYVVEESKVDILITESNTGYGFVGIKIGGVTTSRDQFNANEWSYANGVYTWESQSFTQDLSGAQPVVLEKWYIPGDTTERSVQVVIDEGIGAKLTNTDIGFGYTLSNNLFSSGTEPLYAGNWKVTITSASLFNASIKIYTSSSEYVEYGINEVFEIGSNVTKVVIEITNPNA
ncbi:MAG: hypothetical protein IJ358_01735, partial [Clostridia bacterium]|nr:hypothetical protein [Clostridia bacterium]